MKQLRTKYIISLISITTLALTINFKANAVHGPHVHQKIFGYRNPITAFKQSLRPEKYIHNAALVGDLPQVKRLVDRGAPIDTNNKEGYTPFQLAAYAGHTEVMAYLLSRGADAESTNSRKAWTGFTALHFAAQEGNLHAVDFLIDHRVNINAKNKFGEAPIDLACKNGHRTVVDSLIRAGAYVNIFLAAKSNDTYLLEQIISRAERTLLDMQDSAGNSILHNLVDNNELDERRKLKMMEILFTRGANFNVLNKNGDTPLHQAANKSTLPFIIGDASHGSDSIIPFLISRGAILEARNAQNMTPLHVAASSGALSAVKALMVQGANANVKCGSNFLPIQLAAINHHDNIVSYLQGYVPGMLLL